MEHQHYIEAAIDAACRSVEQGGGPFGAVVAADGGSVATGMNEVYQHADPTAHAEVQAIRAACNVRETFSLAGCTLYASCRPCPMCLGAIYWADIEAVYYAAAPGNAADAGFDDAVIREELARPDAEKAITVAQIQHDRLAEPFTAWRDSNNGAY